MRHITALALLVAGLPLLAEVAPPPTPSWTYMPATAIQAGDTLDGSGDLNGDGWDDLVVGSPGAASGKGRVSVFLSGFTGLPAEPSWTYTGTDASQALGTAICATGDVNGDEVDDLVAGGPGGSFGKGNVLVFLGSKTAPWAPTTASMVLKGKAADGKFGGALSAGDANGDGYDDVLVGAWNEGVVGGTGVVYLFKGTPGGTSTAWAGPGRRRTTRSTWGPPWPSWAT